MAVKDLLLGDEPVEVVHKIEIPNRTILAFSAIALIFALVKFTKR